MQDEKEAVVSIGPLTLEGDVLMIGAQEFFDEIETEIVEEIIEEQSVQLPGYFIYALLGCLVTVVGLLVAVLMLTYRRRQNQKELNLEGDN
jgi:predicted histidine transporter YuiF (NhaC family)